LQIENSCSSIYRRNVACFRYITVNTLHKSDNKCNNNNNPEPELELTNSFIYWGKSIITDKMVHFNRPNTAFIGTENETALIINTTGNLPKTEGDITKYENLALGI
jgi:hypothetical protein